MSKQVQDVETLFCHGLGDELLEEVFGVVAIVGYDEEGPTIILHRPVEEE